MPQGPNGLEVGAENLYPLLHPNKPRWPRPATLECSCYVEPHAVIANYQLQSAVCLVQLDPDVLRPCMLFSEGHSSADLRRARHLLERL